MNTYKQECEAQKNENEMYMFDSNVAPLEAPSVPMLRKFSGQTNKQASFESQMPGGIKGRGTKEHDPSSFLKLTRGHFHKYCP